MEFERIQQLAGTAKVMRTSSEQQRRRREQNAREFSELLEENLGEEEDSNPEEQPASASQDVVSFSNAGKVSAETMRAAGNLARISLAQRQLLELFNPRFSEVADEPVAEDEPAAEPSKFDELA